MALNGSGVYLVDSTGQPVVTSTLIDSTVFNAFTADVATALSTCIMKDGQQTVTANIPFNGMKITGLGAGTARTDAASLATIQDKTGVFVGTVGGTGNAVTLTPSPAITAYATGQRFSWIPTTNNTSTVTVAVSGLAAKALNIGGRGLVGGELFNSVPVTIEYNGTAFNIVEQPIFTDAFTPAISFGTPGDLSVAYTYRSATITRISNRIEVWFQLLTSSFTHSTASGNLLITGFPYRGRSINDAYRGTLSFGGINKASYTQCYVTLAGGVTDAIVYASGMGQTSATVTASDVASGGTVFLSGYLSYLTDGG